MRSKGQYTLAVGNENVCNNTNGVAIGRKSTLSHNNVISINATATAVTSAQGSSFYVNPIRNDTGNSAQTMYYNPTTFEITYNATPSTSDPTLITDGDSDTFVKVEASSDVDTMTSKLEG